MKNSKISIALTLLLIIGLPIKANADSNKHYNVLRLWGNNRYQTAYSIGNETADSNCKNIILANGYSFVDSLTGAALTKKLNAPILLVSNEMYKGSPMDLWEIRGFLKNRAASKANVYILGGTGVVNSAYDNELKSMGYNVIRLGGKNRFNTNELIVNSMNADTGTSMFLVNNANSADILSVSSVASVNKYPIMLCNNNSIPENIKNKIIKNKPEKLYIIGDSKSISLDVEKNLKSQLPQSTIERIYGKDIYDTSLKISDYFGFNSSSAVVANGKTLADALSGSALASKLNAPIVLTDGTSFNKQKQFLDSKDYNNIILLGGTGTIKENIEKAFNGSVIKKDKVFDYEDNKDRIESFTQRDVNGDGKLENLIVTRSKYNLSTKLFLQDIDTGKVISRAILDDYSKNDFGDMSACGKYSNIFTENITGDSVKDILVATYSSAYSGNSNIQNPHLLTVNDNKLKTIDIDENILNRARNWDYSVSDNYILQATSLDTNKKFKVDLSTDTFQKDSSVDPWPGFGPNWHLVDIDNDGVYELECGVLLSWICHADTIAEIIDYYKYDSYNDNLKIVDSNLESGYPIIK